MIWSAFNTAVDDFLTVDASRLGTATFKTRQILSAVIDLQDFIPHYREGHETVYQQDDVTEEGESSVGGLPSTNAFITDAYYVETGVNCNRHPVRVYDWGNRYDLVCGRADAQDCRYHIALDPHGELFYLFPKIEDDTQLILHWDGIKTSFANTDATPFDEQAAEAVAEFVKSRFALHVDREPAMYQIYWANYIRLRRRLYGQRKEAEHIAMQAPTSPPAPQPASCLTGTTEEDETLIEFVAMGDTSNTSDSADVAALVKSLNPDFIVHLGDFSTTTTTPNLLQSAFVPNYFNFVPGLIYPAIGNHDDAYLNGAAIMALFPDRYGSGKRYYAFTMGEAEIFVLNSNAAEPDGNTVGSVQYTWLQTALAASSATWKIVAFHHSPYTSEVTYNPGIAGMRWGFDSLGADLVLSGHGHVYERLLVDGVPYLVAGTGGSALRPFGAILADSLFQYNAEHGCLHIGVSEEMLQATFYNTNSDIIDRLTIKA